MARKTEVPITGPVLAWAIREAGYTEASFADKMKVPSSTVEAWINGTELPGKTEFGKITDYLRRPSAVFFLPKPPAQASIPTKFRNPPGAKNYELSPGTIRELRKARRIQRVMSWLLQEQEEGINLPRLDFRRISATDAGVAIRREVGVSLEQQASWKDPGSALREWRSILDDLDVLTFSLQLGKNDIRGFSAWDERAPIIAINTAYNESARIFTLAHELGHLASRTESACYGWVDPFEFESTTLERWCEEFAAAFLLPPTELRSFVRRNYGISPENPVVEFEKVMKISRRLKVSARALAISLADIQLAPRSLYRKVDKKAQVVDRPKATGGGGGKPTPEKRVGQYGTRVSRAVTEAVSQGTLGARDAADYLDVNLGDLQDISTLVLGARR